MRIKVRGYCYGKISKKLFYIVLFIFDVYLLINSKIRCLK